MEGTYIMREFLALFIALMIVWAYYNPLEVGEWMALVNAGFTETSINIWNGTYDG